PGPPGDRARTGQSGHVRAGRARQLLRLRRAVLRFRQRCLVREPRVQRSLGGGRARVRSATDPGGAAAVLPHATARLEEVGARGGDALGGEVGTAVGGTSALAAGGASGGAGRGASRGPDVSVTGPMGGPNP